MKIILTENQYKRILNEQNILTQVANKVKGYFTSDDNETSKLPNIYMK